MGTAFSSSLFGLSGSLILGFLDLQAGQAQNMFYNDLEDWLSTVTDLDPDMIEGRGGATTAEDLRIAIERLSRTIQEGGGGAAASRRSAAPARPQRATTAMANLAEGIQGLVQHMRSEQQVVRSWVETPGRAAARAAARSSRPLPRALADARRVNSRGRSRTARRSAAPNTGRPSSTSSPTCCSSSSSCCRSSRSSSSCSAARSPARTRC